MTKIIVGQGIAPDPNKVPAVRNFANFITAYQEYTEHLESTPRINLWTALSVVSGALERKIKLVESYGDVFANLYVIIVGPAALTRKSTATGKGIGLLRALTTVNMSAQRITEAALVETLCRAHRRYETLDGTKEQHSSIFAYNGELSSLIKDTNGIVLDLLTDLWDCGGDDSNIPWVKETKGEGQRKVYGPCVGMLSCTVPEVLKELIPISRMASGFASRCCFIYEPDPSPRYMSRIPSELKAKLINMKRMLIDDLIMIHNMKGTMTRTSEAEKLWDKWYGEIYPTEVKKFSDARFGGYYGRKPRHVNTVSMLLSAAQRNDLLVTESDLYAAIKIVDQEEPYMFKLLGAGGKNEDAESIIEVSQYIKKLGFVETAALQTRFFRNINHVQLDGILSSLTNMGQIRFANCGGMHGYGAIAGAPDLSMAIPDSVESES